MGKTKQLNEATPEVPGEEQSPRDISEPLRRELEAQSEQLRATENNLQQALARYRSLFDLAPNPYFCIDSTGRISESNRAAAKLVGSRPSELRGRPLSALVVADDAAVLARHIREVLAGDETRDVRFRIAVERDARTLHIPVHMRSAPAGSREAEPLCHCILTDETPAIEAKRERERLERDRDEVTRQLFQSQKMEAIGTLSSGVAHDFNNLLMGIMGCVEVARAALPDSSAAHLYLDEIWRSASSGAGIARQLLVFARKQTGSPEVFELDGAVLRLQALLAHFLGEDIDIQLRLQAPDHCIRMDPGHLEQVILNLAVNSRDAMPDGGRLTLSTRVCTAREMPRLELKVTDSGSGMDEAALRRAVEPFFSTKEPGQGTGLGLAIVHGIVLQAGGELELQSEPGAGTTVLLHIPASDHPPTHPAPDPTSQHRAPLQGTVLLVEDDPLVRMGVRFFLEGFGLRVLDAASALDAEECCDQFPGTIDAILTDIMLPDRSGAALARKIRSRAPGAAVVYMSALLEDELRRQGRIEDGDHFLQKPFEPHVLYNIVARLLEPAKEPRRRSGSRPTTEEHAHWPATTPRDTQPLRVAEIEEMFAALQSGETGPRDGEPREPSDADLDETED